MNFRKNQKSKHYVLAPEVSVNFKSKQLQQNKLYYKINQTLFYFIVSNGL